MNPLSTNDLWPLPVYEGVRDQFRREVIAAKKDRRVTVGPHVTFLFENRLTVKFQVQEVLRAERIVDPAQVAEELQGWSDMLQPGCLSATLMIELLGSDAEVKAELRRLYGLSRHLWLELAGERIRIEMEPGREEEERGVAAVQYVHIRVPDPQALLRGPAAIVIDHPNYSHRAGLTDNVRSSLARDLL
jgi:hypothetical protein